MLQLYKYHIYTYIHTCANYKYLLQKFCILWQDRFFLFTRHSNHLEFQNKMSDNSPLLSGSQGTNQKNLTDYTLHQVINIQKWILIFFSNQSLINKNQGTAELSSSGSKETKPSTPQTFPSQMRTENQNGHTTIISSTVTLGITKHPQLHPLNFVPIPKWITFHSGIILNETILTRREICAFDSTLLNFLINSQYSKAANQKTILNKVFILPAKKTIVLSYFSIPPRCQQNIHYTTWFKLQSNNVTSNLAHHIHPHYWS